MHISSNTATSTYQYVRKYKQRFETCSVYRRHMFPFMRSFLFPSLLTAVHQDTHYNWPIHAGKRLSLLLKPNNPTRHVCLRHASYRYIYKHYLYTAPFSREIVCGSVYLSPAHRLLYCFIQQRNGIRHRLVFPDSIDGRGGGWGGHVSPPPFPAKASCGPLSLYAASNTASTQAAPSPGKMP